MGIATLKWNDHNRFNQTGYSAPTLIPQEEDYTDTRLYLDDLMKAEAREVDHREFIEELREDAKAAAYWEAQEERILDDEQHNEGWI